jgi:hypothetical protein
VRGGCLASLDSAHCKQFTVTSKRQHMHTVCC